MRYVERQRRRWPRAAIIRRAQGGCGLIQRQNSSSMLSHRSRHPSLSEPREAPVRDPLYFFNSPLACGLPNPNLTRHRRSVPIHQKGVGSDRCALKREDEPGPLFYQRWRLVLASFPHELEGGACDLILVEPHQVHAVVEDDELHDFTGENLSLSREKPRLATLTAYVYPMDRDMIGNPELCSELRVGGCGGFVEGTGCGQTSNQAERDRPGQNSWASQAPSSQLSPDSAHRKRHRTSTRDPELPHSFGRAPLEH